MSIGQTLVDDGIIILEKVARSGDILLRDEMEKMIAEGLIEALTPNNLIFHQKSNTKVITFRLKHIMTPLRWNGVTVPVFGCIFFNHESRKCEIFTRDFRPRQCRIFPFNKLHMARKLEQDNTIRGHITIVPMCGLERLRGFLTAEQTKQVKEYLDLLKPPKKVLTTDSASSWKKLLTKLRFPAAIPVSDRDLQVLGIAVKRESASEGWAIVDWRRDLARINTEMLSSVYGKDKLNPRMTDEQNHFAQHIKKKFAKSYEWWRDFRLSKKNIKEIYETMVEVFYDRYTSNLLLQNVKGRNIFLYNYLLSLRG